MSGGGLDNFLVDGATVRPLQKARLEMMSGSQPLPRSFSVTTSISLVVTYPPPRNYRRRRFYTSSPTAPHCGTANCETKALFCGAHRILWKRDIHIQFYPTLSTHQTTTRINKVA